jgi:protein gp37
LQYGNLFAKSNQTIKILTLLIRRILMADKTAIEWTNATWNPITGCTKISPGCDNCYAERFSERFRNVQGHPFENGFDLTLRPHRLNEPLKWQRSKMIFVNSMSDLFHKKIPLHYIDQVFETMEKASWHKFQLLTKRSSRMKKYINDRYGTIGVPEHIWLGVSIEDRQRLSRLKHLSETTAAIRFLSLEPLIGPIGSMDLINIDWVIVGGESGPRYRPIEAEWVREIRDQCIEQSVAFFFKQWGGVRPKSGGRSIDNVEWNEFPLESVRRKQHYQSFLETI